MRFKAASVLSIVSLTLVLMAGIASAATLTKVAVTTEIDGVVQGWATDSTDPAALIKPLAVVPSVSPDPVELKSETGLYIFSFSGVGVFPSDSNFTITFTLQDSTGAVFNTALTNGNGSMVPPAATQVDLPEDKVSVKAVDFVINSLLAANEAEVDAATEGQFVLQAVELLTDIEVQIDIKPGSYPNSINLKSRGVIPVAVLGSAEFDVQTVDPASVKFAGAGFRKFAYADINHDGILDMMFHFLTQEITELDGNSTEATVTGETKDGVKFYGTDTVNIVPKGKSNGPK